MTSVVGMLFDFHKPKHWQQYLNNSSYDMSENYTHNTHLLSTCKTRTFYFTVLNILASCYIIET